MDFYYRSYSDLSAIITKNLDKFAKYNPDLIVGIPRSGMIPAYIIALFLNTNCCSFFEFYMNQKLIKYGSRTILDTINNPQDAKRILIIDDSYGKGEKLAELVQSLPDKIRSKCIVGVIYSAEKKLPLNSIIEFYLEYIPKPRFFEWNIYHHNLVRKSAFDIDGVLCFDPTQAENDDGEAYLSFLLNARPKFIPTLPIHTLVTSRLEKYRSQTETWLKKYKIVFTQLVMLDLPNKEERKRMNVYAKHKAEIYNNNDELVLFFESSEKQAQEIFSITKKPVFCIETNRLYNE